MSKINRRVNGFLFFTIISFCFLSTFNKIFAAPVFYDQSTVGNSSETIDTPYKPKTEGNTGALNYNYKFKIPDGRNKMSPDLTLLYNSQNENNQNLAGYGFNLSIPFIQRINKNGVDKMYTDENSKYFFTTNNYGDLVKSTSTNIYVAKKSDASLAEFNIVGDTWEVNDNNGLKYIYGGSMESKVQNASNTAQIYSWYITDVFDIFGNNIHYSYIKDAGFVYPDRITYTNNSKNNLSGIYSINFNYEDRLDNLESYATGFLVKNNKRINSIDVLVQGVKRKSFAIRYKTGVNTVRSLLAGIIETGFDTNNTPKSLPETIFNYSLPEKSTVTFNLPDQFDRIADINGDGLVDFILSRAVTDAKNNITTTKNIYLNKGVTNNQSLNGQIQFELKTATSSEIPFLLSNNYAGNYNGTNAYPENRFLLDSDGDGNLDVVDGYNSFRGTNFKDILKFSTTTLTIGTTTQVVTSTSTERIYATSSLFWIPDSSLNIPTNTNIVKINNIDGDRKPDISYRGKYNADPELEDSAIVYFDINGDGLDDKVQVYNDKPFYKIPKTMYKNIWINNGTSFIQLDATSTLKYNLPITFEKIVGSYYSSSNLYVDTNFDGLDDTLTIDGGSSINTGVGLDGSYNYGDASYLPAAKNVFTADLNGDGLQDIVTVVPNLNQYSVVLSKMKADLITSVKNSYGGESTFQFASVNKMSSPVWTLKSQIENDLNGNIATTNYEYVDGFISRLGNFDNIFSGFGKVTTISPNGLKTISYYHLGNGDGGDEINDSQSKVGKIYKQEIYNSQGNLEKKDLLEYTDFYNPLSSSSTNSFLSKNISFIYDQNNGQVFSTAMQNFYDNNLNKIRTIDFGDVIATSTTNIIDVNASDTKIFETIYNKSATQQKKFYATSLTKKDLANNILNQENYFYDGNTDNKISNGLLTTKEIYNSTSTKQVEKSIYDTDYGLTSQKINISGATTTYVYDIFKLFPIQTINGLNQKTNYTYDYNVCTPIKTLDPNNIETKTEYDQLGRISKNYLNNNLLEEKIYNDSYLPNIEIKKYFSATDRLSTVYNFDGFGKTIKAKTENPNGEYTSRGITYDNMGNIISENLNDINLKSITRDSFGRMIETKSVLGIDKNVYGGRTITKLDKNNHPIIYEYNNDGQIKNVTENNSGPNYTTKYSYDLNNNLVNILDAESQNRNITYDWIGRKVTDELTHKNATTSVSVTKFVYGDKFVVASTTDGVNLKTSYDILGRKISDITSQQIATTTLIKIGTSTTSTTTYLTISNLLNEYSYDNCANGIAKICIASSSDGVIKKYSYDSLGNISKIETVVNNTLWSPNSTTYYTYDLQGNILTQGDGSATTTNTYLKNYLQNINYWDLNSASSTNVFTNPTYNNIGQIVSYDRGNIKQINTYDEQNLNRLQNLALLKYGDSSFQFATSSQVFLPLNNSTTTNLVSRFKNSTSTISTNSATTTKLIQFYATNTKPIITNFTVILSGQGLYPKVNLNIYDAENDLATNTEIYFKEKDISTTTSTTSKYFFINNQAIVDNFPFQFNKSYDFVSRVKDTYGDWSNYATTTFSTTNKNSSTTNFVYCKNKITTDLGSVNCPDPLFNVAINNSGLNLVGNIIIATSTNIVSSTIDSFAVGKKLNIKLKQNSKYYYLLPDGSINLFTTGDFKTFQNSTYSYDTLSRIKSILKDEDNTYENTIYNYDDLSRLTQVSNITNANSTTTNIKEFFNYSPTGKILQNQSGNTLSNYLYNSTAAFTPTNVNGDILNWDSRGRFASSTSMGNVSWNDLDRIKEIKNTKDNIGTTSKYFYDTEGNRVLSLIFNNQKINTKLFTPESWIQNTGSTTTYSINFQNKPIINIDRNFISASSSSVTSFTKWIGVKDGSSNELLSTATIPIFSDTNSATTSNLNNILPFVGKKTFSKYQRLSFSSLVVGVPQKVAIYFATSSAVQTIPVIFSTGTGTINSQSSFIPKSGGSFEINFTPGMPNIVLQIGSTNYTTDNYAAIDAYYLDLKTSTSTPETYTTNIQTLITNHLNSLEKVIDFKTGNIISTSTYSSFGKLEKNGNVNSNRGFTNHQDDQSASGLIYMNNRYQNPNLGIFMSPDIATKNIDSKSNLLLNPQSLNPYSYTWNNPINAYDPDGKMTIIIPGTWYSNEQWGNTSNPLFMNTMQTFGEIPIVLNNKDVWSGGDNKASREVAINYLSEVINSHYSSFDTISEKLNIVGHSHGGNIAKGLTHKIIKSIDNLVLLGTPVRNDYKESQDSVSNLINVYSYIDLVQNNGGNDFSSLKNHYGEFGVAERHVENAKNVNATMYTFSLDENNNSHTKLWSNGKVWLDKVVPNIIK